MTIITHKFFLLSLLCLTCLWTVVICQNSLNIIREWVQLEFVYPNEEARVWAVTNKYFVPEVSIPVDVDVYYGYGTQNPRIFITVPRFDVGRPITLGTVGEDGLISGYPDYSWHDNQGRNCKGLTCVFGVTIDNCHRLWVVDTGKIGNQQKCQPQILAFDLKTDQLIYRYRVPSENFIATTRFVALVVDVRGSGPNQCSDTFVYVADLSGFGLLVVDVARDRSWRVTHPYFFPYPSRGSFFLEGESFDIMDGVLGMALSPYVEGSDRLLYFHALASTTENVVRTSLLRNDSFIEDPNANPNSINVFQAERPSQSGAEAMGDDGFLYFGLVEPPSMWSWNTSTKFSPYNFNEIAVSGELLPFPLGVNIVHNPIGHQELWVLTSNFHRAFSGNLTTDRINVRLHAGKIPAVWNTQLLHEDILLECLVGFKAPAYITRVPSVKADDKELQVPPSEDADFLIRYASCHMSIKFLLYRVCVESNISILMS